MVKMEPIFEVGGINIMKTIEEAASKINAKRANQSKYDISDAFRDGVEFAQEWIPSDNELPEQIINPSEQSNGNTLYFYENYLVKGYWMNEAMREDILMATYMPCSVCWYFNVHLPNNCVGFMVTHWRPINRK